MGEQHAPEMSFNVVTPSTDNNGSMNERASHANRTQEQPGCSASQGSANDVSGRASNTIAKEAPRVGVATGRGISLSPDMLASATTCASSVSNSARSCSSQLRLGTVLDTMRAAYTAAARLRAAAPDTTSVSGWMATPRKLCCGEGEGEGVIITARRAPPVAKGDFGGRLRGS